LTTAYSLVDKWNIGGGAAAIAYAYLTIPVAALLLTPVVLPHPGRIAESRRESGWRIPAVSDLT
jgi:hypothetical protein